MLLALGGLTLLLLNHALFSTWMAGGPPNEYQEGWSRMSLAWLSWSLASAVAAGAAFRLVRSAPPVGRLVACAVGVAAMLALAPFIARELLIDKCLDNGGRWNAEALACER